MNPITASSSPSSLSLTSQEYQQSQESQESRDTPSTSEQREFCRSIESVYRHTQPYGFVVLRNPESEPVQVLGEANMTHSFARGGFSTIHYARLQLDGAVTDVALRFIRNPSHFRLLEKEHTLLQEIQESDHDEKSYFPASFGYSRQLHMEEWIPFNLGYYQYIKTINLIEKRERGETLPCAEPVRVGVVHSIVHHLLKAVDFLHRNNILHGDLSADNIGFKTLETSSLKILDFGCAELLEKDPQSHCTRPKKTSQKGKTLYQSPESLEGGPLGVSTDLYALAMMLFRLCGTKELFPPSSNISDLKVYRRTLPYRDKETQITQIPFSLKKELDALPAIKFIEGEPHLFRRKKERLRSCLERFLNQDPHCRGTAGITLQLDFPETASNEHLFP